MKDLDSIARSYTKNGTIVNRLFPFYGIPGAEGLERVGIDDPFVAVAAGAARGHAGHQRGAEQPLRRRLQRRPLPRPPRPQRGAAPPGPVGRAHRQLQPGPFQHFISQSSRTLLERDLK